jgi:hypothetical protein
MEIWEATQLRLLLEWGCKNFCTENVLEKGRVEDLKRKQRSCSGVGIEDIVNYIVTLPVAQCVVPRSIWR